VLKDTRTLDANWRNPRLIDHQNLNITLISNAYSKINKPSLISQIQYLYCMYSLPYHNATTPTNYRFHPLPTPALLKHTCTLTPFDATDALTKKPAFGEYIQNTESTSPEVASASSCRKNKACVSYHVRLIRRLHWLNNKYLSPIPAS